jgi:PTH1 family peptidyl-tRNA hydrolase
MFLIIGLGNPGEKYNLTRHNAGFMAVDYLAKKWSGSWQNHKKSNSLVTKIAATNGRPTIILAKPQTLMNNSGLAVVKLLSFYNLWPKKMSLFKKKESNLSQTLLIIHDDLDLPLGRFKISLNRGSAGHNGVQSIINQLKTKNFTRLRLGISTPKKNLIGGEKFVMEKFKNEEIIIINQTIKKATDEIASLL